MVFRFYVDPLFWIETIFFLLVWGKQKIPISLGNQDFNVFSFLRSGATRNRNLMISGWISLMYILAKEVISRYCSTGFLQYFAVSCGVDFLLLYKGNALFWNTSRCLVFLFHLIGELQFKWIILQNILVKWCSCFYK